MQFLWGFLFILSAQANWGRETFDHQQLSDPQEKAILATAELIKPDEYGTAFFVGIYKGEYLMATNYHLMPDQGSCNGAKVNFKALGFQTVCKKLLGAWKNIEFALFTVTTPKNDVLLANHSLKLNFNNDVVAGVKLFTAGYGHFQNMSESLTFDRSSSCQTLSGNDYTFVSANESFGAYSFKHGCAASGGDSGSALLDSTTGDVVGIHWAITNFKGNAELSNYSSGFVTDFLGVGTNFGVPSVLIKKTILESNFNTNGIIEDFLQGLSQ